MTKKSNAKETRKEMIIEIITTAGKPVTVKQIITGANSRQIYPTASTIRRDLNELMNDVKVIKIETKKEVLWNVVTEKKEESDKKNELAAIVKEITTKFKNVSTKAATGLANQILDGKDNMNRVMEMLAAQQATKAKEQKPIETKKPATKKPATKKPIKKNQAKKYSRITATAAVLKNNKGKSFTLDELVTFADDNYAANGGKINPKEAKYYLNISLKLMEELSQVISNADGTFTVCL